MVPSNQLRHRFQHYGRTRFFKPGAVKLLQGPPSAPGGAQNLLALLWACLDLDHGPGCPTQTPAGKRPCGGAPCPQRVPRCDSGMSRMRAGTAALLEPAANPPAGPYVGALLRMIRTRLLCLHSPSPSPRSGTWPPHAGLSTQPQWGSPGRCVGSAALRTTATALIACRSMHIARSASRILILIVVIN